MKTLLLAATAAALALTTVPAASQTAAPLIERTKLFGFEVDLLVEAPGGARPGSVPPLYEDDGPWLADHSDDPAGALLAG